MSVSTKVSIIGLILSLTLACSLYYKRKYRHFFESGDGLVLKTLPKFSLKSLLSGEMVSSENIFEQGKKFGMIHFWATWCAPCEAELPEFIDLAKKFEEMAFVLIAVNDDDGKIRKFFKRFESLPSNVSLAHDRDGGISARFGTIKLPETYLFSKNKRHVNKYVGPQEWGRKSVEVRLRFYLESIGKPDDGEYGRKNKYPGAGGN